MCVPVTMIHNYNGEIWIPFYGPTSKPYKYDSTWEQEFLARKNGVHAIPTGEYFMAVAVSDVWEAKDTDRAKELLREWYKNLKKMTFNEHEIFIHLWLGVLPALKKYVGGATAK